MKKIFSILAVSAIFFFSCTGETRETGDQTSRDSAESKSTSDTASMNTGMDTSVSNPNPAAPGATNAEY